jgi:hypothetical protein
MKKIYKLRQENKKHERVIEETKHNIRKYIKRERSKKLPESMDYWDFDCRFGEDSDDAISTHLSQIIASLDKAYDAKWEQCYVEILAKPAKREIKQKEEPNMQELPSTDGS